MARIQLDIVTAEKSVYSGEVDLLVAPGVEGQLGILPHHSPLMTMLQPGELMIRKGGQEEYLTITGGFMEVRPDRVIILADASERAEEIDVARAEAAKKRALERLAHRTAGTDVTQAEATLQRAMVRLSIVERRKKRRSQSSENLR